MLLYNNINNNFNINNNNLSRRLYKNIIYSSIVDTPIICIIIITIKKQYVYFDKQMNDRK